MPSPNRDPAKMTKMAEIRMPIRPSNSFLEEQPSSPSSSDIDSCGRGRARKEIEERRGRAGRGGLSEMCLDGYKEGDTGCCALVLQLNNT